MKDKESRKTRIKTDTYRILNVFCVIKHKQNMVMGIPPQCYYEVLKNLKLFNSQMI